MSAMTEFVNQWGPYLLMFLTNLIYLSYRFGRLEEKMVSHQERIGRLEKVNDFRLNQSQGD